VGTSTIHLHTKPHLPPPAICQFLLLTRQQARVLSLYILQKTLHHINHVKCFKVNHFRLTNALLLPHTPARHHIVFSDYRKLTRQVITAAVLLFFNPLNAGLGALYGASVSRMLPTSVHCMEVDAFKGTTNFKHHPFLGGRSSVTGGLRRCSTEFLWPRKTPCRKNGNLTVSQQTKNPQTPEASKFLTL